MKALRTCPICGRPAGEAAALGGSFPFCSKRCADIDLLRWLKGNYAIPAEGETDADSVGTDAGEDHAAPTPPRRH